MAVTNKLVILGNSSASPTINRHHTAQYFQFGKEHILIDCGEGTQKRMLEEGIGFNKINHIFISHLHGDHYLGLVGLLNTMGLNGRSKELHIYAPKELESIVGAHFKISSHYQNFDIHFYAHQEDSFTIILDQLEVTAFPLIHRINCHGFLFKESQSEKKLNIEKCQLLEIPVSMYKGIKKGENIIWNDQQFHNEELTLPFPSPLSYAYLSDTRYSRNFIPYVKNASLMYHEATFLHNLVDRAEMTAHSTALEAGMFAKEASVGQLIIGHFSSRYVSLEEHLNEAKSQFENSFIAEEGSIFHLS